VDSDAFVRAIERHARDSAINSTVSNLDLPPGRSPEPELLEASKWYCGLSDSEKRVVQWIIHLATDHATLGFLAIIDGSRAIEGGPSKGHLELYYCAEGERRLLNDPAKEPLNDKLMV